ncbi:hypothetical protein Syun_024352 [Stephania yunnanensis]|uniref:DNA-directed DNA polymerase n=1 Tax=Stephania yunnanensis TaxID=152371 RepID=A0AAP0NKM6_9MAGN
MLDGRRHSVDIPLSKALVALRRVRSLRDPSTNSMAKLSSHVDNIDWETDSFNGVSLHFANQCRRRNAGFDGGRTGSVSDPELDACREAENLNLGSLGRRRSESKKKIKVKKRLGCPPRLIGGGNGNGNGDGNVDFQTNVFDESVENNGHIEKALDISLNSQCESFERGVQKRRFRHGRQLITSEAARDDTGSCVASSYPSLSDEQIDGSSRSASLFANDDDDDDDDDRLVNYSNCGCGISCCWSRTPRLRESSAPSDVEDHPLLSGGGEKICLLEHKRSCSDVKNEIAPYRGSPRSLSHKFRPRKFSELLGQHVVARSLLNGILRGKITQLYLFHGPRGTGKTSTAKIFAAALNCLSLEETRPCGLCHECVLFSCGRSRDIKEVDPVKANRTEKFRSLLKYAARPPVSSRFKVLIIDECQLLHDETWASVLNCLDGLPRHVVFVMVTADLDSVPRNAVSRCQRHHFPKVNNCDIVNKLSRICVEEGLEFDKVALDFIAAKSNGSLRDAEMILDQLSLLGKRITISLTHELIGIVSDEELLDLLDLALSSDTANTVRRARELMSSRVDPMQLISQLANLIMDILAGRYQTGTEPGRIVFKRMTSEADLQKLRNVLKLLSETEKQLRTSRNQSTWLTVALLQLSSADVSSLDSNDSRTCATKPPDSKFCDTSTRGESFNRPVSCLVTDTNSQNLEIHRYSEEKLEAIWRGAVENCQSRKLRNFLQKEGKLSSVCVHHGLAVVEVEFCHRDHVSKAEKSWKFIASSLQLVLGCNVEITIKLGPRHPRKNLKLMNSCFGLWSCPCGKLSSINDGNYWSEYSDFASGRAIIGEKPVETCSIGHGSLFSPIHCHCKEAVAVVNEKSRRDQSHGSHGTLSTNAIQDGSTRKSQLRSHSPKLDGINHEIQVLSIQDPQAAKTNSSLQSPNAPHKICLRVQPQEKFELSIPQKQPFETYFCADDPYILCSSSNTLGNSSRDEELRPGKESELRVKKLRCWKAPKFMLRKGSQLRQHHQRCLSGGWILPCATST